LAEVVEVVHGPEAEVALVECIIIVASQLHQAQLTLLPLVLVVAKVVPVMEVMV
jgi:hypothetical protein